MRLTIDNLELGWTSTVWGGGGDIGYSVVRIVFLYSNPEGTWDRKVVKNGLVAQ